MWGPRREIGFLLHWWVALTLACAVTAGPGGGGGEDTFVLWGGAVFSLDSAFFHFYAFVFVFLVLILTIKLQGGCDCGTGISRSLSRGVRNLWKYLSDMLDFPDVWIAIIKVLEIGFDDIHKNDVEGFLWCLIFLLISLCSNFYYKSNTCSFWEVELCERYTA